MATKKEKKQMAPEEEKVLAQESASEELSEAVDVETVAEPTGQRIDSKQPAAQPALTAATRRSAAERARDAAGYKTSVEARQEEAMTVGRYLTARNRNNVLSGEISGVEVRDSHAFWVIYDGPVTVLIPFHEALPTAQGNVLANSKDELMRHRQLLSKSVGATIPFSVEHMEQEEDGYLVFGSRRIAVERIRKRYFGAEAPNPAAVGDTLAGTFLSVGPHAAWLCVNGLDIRMIPRQLSHRYMENMMDVYKPGDEVELRVIRLYNKNGEFDPELSALPCELDACRPRLSRVRKGNRYAATITTHRNINTKDPRTGTTVPRYVATMWLEGVEVPAFATVVSSHASGNAYSGERVMVEVDDIARNGYVRCRILAYLP